MEKPQVIGKALVDGDIIAYRAAFATQEGSSSDARNKVDELLEYCIRQTVVFENSENFKVYLTGGGNFRFDIREDYKGNRKGEKPEHLEDCRYYLMAHWDAELADGQEADDAIVIESYKSNQETSVIVSQDKDFNQVPTWKYDFTKDVWRYDTQESALKFFYTQVLTGDRVDNIQGLWRVGPVKAGKILEGCVTEEELYRATLEAYDGDVERLMETARLLYLRTYEEEMWYPPDMRESVDETSIS